MLSFVLVIASITSLQAGTLITPSYRITIESRCPEGEIACENVKYVGVDKRTGKSIVLIGREIHTMGPDGVTPARFLGYLFKNGKTTYFVGEDGELRVTQGSKLLVEEMGTWTWQRPTPPS
jgi:hypothetical protein